MIKKSTYVLLTGLMLVALSLFLILGDSANMFFAFDDNAETLDYDKYEIKTTSDKIGSYADITAEDFCAAVLNGGGSDTESATAVIDAFGYLKKNYFLTATAASLGKPDGKIDLIVIAYKVSSENDINRLAEYTDAGVNMIFTVLPDEGIIRENATLRRMLGINHYVDAAYEMDGLTLFENFLLGGKAIYDDYKVTLPYIETLSTVKTYAVGYLENQKTDGIRNESLPAIIWRNSYGNAFVCATVTDYLQRDWGVGIAYALFAEMEGTYVYPVINAQTTMIMNYPNLSDENGDAVAKLYGQRTMNFMRFSVWSTIVSNLNSGDNVMTCFLTTRYDRANNGLSVNTDLLDFYIKMVSAQKGELAFSGAAVAYEDGFDFFKSDMAAINGASPELRFSAFYQGDMTDEDCAAVLDEDGALSYVNTIVRNGERDYSFGYFGDGNRVISLPVTDNPVEHTTEDDIKLRSIETALAASNIGVDLSRIIYPENDLDNWKNFAIEWSKNAYTYWMPFKAFNRVKVSDADLAVRRYLALDYEWKKDGDKVNITLENFDESAYFIIKTQDKKIMNVTGGTYDKISDDFFLISATEASVTLTLGAPFDK